MVELEAAFWPIDRQVSSFAAGEVSPVELTEALLARIDAFDAQLHSYLTVTPELARTQAREAEIRYRRGSGAGPLPLLLGVAVSIKDLFDLEGVPTTLGSRISETGPAPADSTVVARLRRAGAVFLGKTNTAEFGQSATTENELGPACGNPWDPQRTAGGSSGGAAASVAAGLATAGLGSDGGGSIRIPAAMCGLFGIKPTIGAVPDDGPFRAMTDFSCPGPIVRCVADARRVMQVILDEDLGARDRTARFRIGWCAAPDDQPVDPGVRAVAERAAALLRELGHTVEPISLPFDGWMDAFGPLVLADEWRLRRYLLDERADELSDYARRAIAAGERITPEAVSAARVRHAEFRRRLLTVFDNHDLIATPTTACVAFETGARPRAIGGRPVDPLWGPFPFTAPISVSGAPAASVPVGLADGLPVGLQIIGPWHSERALLDVSGQLEEADGFPSGEMARRYAMPSGRS